MLTSKGSLFVIMKYSFIYLLPFNILRSLFFLMLNISHLWPVGLYSWLLGQFLIASLLSGPIVWAHLELFLP